MGFNPPKTIKTFTDSELWGSHHEPATQPHVLTQNHKDKAMQTLSRKTVEETVALIVQRVIANQDAYGNEFPTRGYPVYETAPNNHWVAGFWTALLWLTYHHTGEASLRAKAESLYPTFVERLDKQVHITHDMGFVYLLGCRTQWMLTDNRAARDTALRAADILVKRYNPNGKYIQAWGKIGEEPEAGRIIIDTMMNLNLLYWASEQTGDSRYREVARNHALASQNHLVRADFSTYHTFFFNPQTGEPRYGATHQGYADESLWARGQAWAVYGFALSAEWLNEAEFLATSQATADRFLADSPATQVPLWDFRLPSEATPYYDSSAGAIMACGLLRLAKLTGNHYYRQQAEVLLNTLITHCLEIDPTRQGVLKHGAQHVPHNHTPDGYIIYGDYFLLEALLTISSATTPDLWGSSK